MPTSLAPNNQILPALPPEAIELISQSEKHCLSHAQIDIQTEHVLHGGLYSRTIRLAPGAVIHGCLTKVPTQVITAGSCLVHTGTHWAVLDGFQILAGSKGRKQIFVALRPTAITMVFRTDAKTIEQAEDEMTDEAAKLISRTKDDDIKLVTGE